MYAKHGIFIPFRNCRSDAVSTKTYLVTFLALNWLGDELLGGASNLPAAGEAVAKYLSH